MTIRSLPLTCCALLVAGCAATPPADGNDKIRRWTPGGQRRCERVQSDTAARRKCGEVYDHDLRGPAFGILMQGGRALPLGGPIQARGRHLGYGTLLGFLTATCHSRAGACRPGVSPTAELIRDRDLRGRGACDSARAPYSTGWSREMIKLFYACQCVLQLAKPVLSRLCGRASDNHTTHKLFLLRHALLSFADVSVGKRRAVGRRHGRLPSPPQRTRVYLRHRLASQISIGPSLRRSPNCP